MLSSPNYADVHTISTMNVTSYETAKAAKMSPKQVEFSVWLQKQMDGRGWGQADLANRAGINRQVVWGYLNRRKKPSEDILIKIANALEIPPQEILRAAGVLPTESNHDAITEAIVHLIGDLDTSTKQDILDYAKFKKSQSGKG